MRGPLRQHFRLGQDDYPEAKPGHQLHERLGVRQPLLVIFVDPGGCAGRDSNWPTVQTPVLPSRSITRRLAPVEDGGSVTSGAGATGEERLLEWPVQRRDSYTGVHEDHAAGCRTRGVRLELVAGLRLR